MRIGLLGPVTAGPDGAPAPGGVRLRVALARLALDAGRTVPRDVLVDALWGAEPADAVTNALQAHYARDAGSGSATAGSASATSRA